MSNNYKIVITVHNCRGYRSETFGLSSTGMDIAIRDVQYFIRGLHCNQDIERISIDSISKVANLKDLTPMDVTLARRIGAQVQKDVRNGK